MGREMKGMQSYRWWKRIADIVRGCLFPDSDGRRIFFGICISLIVPVCVLAVRPLDMDGRQTAVFAAVLLTVIWWAADIVKKIPASIFLLAVFCLISGTGIEEIFAFPLSETFPMLVVTYLFSQGIANSGIVERMIEPLLFKTVHTPYQCIAAIILVFFVAAYMIPQPLARLVIVAAVFHRFLEKAEITQETKNVLMYAVFIFYAVVNMSSKDADMIMNCLASDFLKGGITNGTWIRGMFLPTVFTCIIVAALFRVLFRTHLSNCHICTREGGERTVFSGKQKTAALIIGGTIVLWATHSIHGINNTLITFAAVMALFATKTLGKNDLAAVDVTTLFFLTAAFSIGGVMEGCGVADKVFGVFENVFPEHFSVGYVAVMIGISMALHMILGSNTTTLSVVVPGLMILCGDLLPAEVIVFITVISVSFHAVLPFHSVSLMIGASEGYFPSCYVMRFGVPATLLVYAVVLGIYFPYWTVTGLL